MIKKLPTVILGNGFELHCQRLLSQQMHMSLVRIGGKGDGGIDLRGWWDIPDTREPVSVNEQASLRRIRVLAQCKAEKKAPGPRLVREMEGVARREYDLLKEESHHGLAESSDTQAGGSIALEPVVALLCSSSGFSPAAVVEANRSRTPMLLLHIPFDYQEMLLSTPDPITNAVDHELLEKMPMTLQGAFWNAALMGSRGLLRDGWELRKEFSQSVTGSRFRIAMHLHGQRL
ncbi:hypothetical protein QFC22_003579 [Naganishia vaughanmartiniae]|uniref:Uncharacterized protein n=1 Tax=Naganishia vaughanmartiniae TaxID=1424756 RepID=A0ACC2X628_9TREE|nr:hypothetical protein QFC22_003579 [Naganishia vaughanmartiniae]